MLLLNINQVSLNILLNFVQMDLENECVLENNDSFSSRAGIWVMNKAEL